jgi:hypothetical protein
LPVPETRTERLLFVLGLAVIAGLAYSIVRLRANDPPRHAAATVSSRSPGVDTTTSTGETTTASAWIRLRVTARADAPVTVRRGSSTGRVLYQSTLGGGETRSFTGARLWVHFGNANDVTATLDGARLALPTGTYSALVTSGGLEKQST